MLKKVDHLPVGPTWNCDNIRVTGNILGPNKQFLTEDLEIWRRNAVTCVADLMGNTTFKDYIVYKPVRVKRNGQRYYSEMCMSEWWWKIQVHTTPTRAHISAHPTSPTSRVVRLSRAWFLHLTKQTCLCSEGIRLRGPSTLHWPTLTRMFTRSHCCMHLSFLDTSPWPNWRALAMLPEETLNNAFSMNV